MDRRLLVVVALALIVAASALYVLQQGQPRGKATLRIATTTSLDATGLLDALKREFESMYPDINVTWVAVGTGQAIEIAKRGDADLVLTHDRPLEDQFIIEGYGLHAASFAYNDFAVLGPSDDPAGVRGAKSVVEAFRLIAEAGKQGKAVFVSRGDRSGTHLKELRIWKKAGVDVAGQPWYKETGQGMSQTLMVADQLKNAYTLSDRSTYTAFKDKLSLKVVFEGDPELLNIYRATLVNKTRFPWVNYDAAYKFVKFIVSPKGQALIGNYSKGGAKLFVACFGNLAKLGVNDPYEEQQVAWWREQLQEDP
ncbi:extracellular solute-binding protein [Infirmifilum lucidum]|uniref:Extracellular solute-binding protein n=1 Tax=Infirmifilum lucidum TaxID=2776706 RepID=A0A7L9FGZ1_9CREN|nr:substrate-binding domain-containing protein [Infirmifilum lucidum]QOJ79098.1 extracellular solute-binding protein [Infirmifilum lucidum]